MIEDIASHHSRLDCEPGQNKIVVEPPICSCHTAPYIILRYLFTTYFNTKHTDTGTGYVFKNSTWKAI